MPQACSCGSILGPRNKSGQCHRCYMRVYLADYRRNPINASRAAEQKHQWYLENVTTEGQEQVRDLKHFSGLRFRALQRDGFKCTICGSGNQLVVHHKDRSGRGAKTHNNRLSNLQTMCRACHARHHNTTGRWSKDHDACIVCGRSDRAHNARGMCTACYCRTAYKMKIQSGLHGDVQSAAEMTAPVHQHE